MNMTLAGLTTREEVAMGMLVGKTLPGWKCGAVPAGRGVSLPPSDLYVVDLAGRGLARWTETAQSELLKALSGSPAVLVVPAFDQSWSALDERQTESQPLVLLHKPYGTEDMRAALKRAAAVRASRAVPTPVVLPLKPPAPAKKRTPVAQAARVPAVPAVFASPSVPSPVAALEAGAAMTAGQFQAWLGALPEAESPLFLRKLGKALALQQAFEVRVSFVNRLICDPAGQWLASNTSASVLAQLCRSDDLASAVEIDSIDGDALERAQRLGLSSGPLAPFLWQLSQAQPSQ